MEITTKSRRALKAHFVKYSTPTDTSFSELIDGMINHAEDGIAKITDNPLAIQSEGDTQELIDFYESFDDENPAWAIGQNPRVDIGDPDTAIPGFNISDSGGNSRLFIDKSTGKLGIGTIEPAEVLSVAGNIQASGVLKIDSSDTSYIKGNLGVGNTEPGEALDVTGNIRTSGVLKIDGSGSSYITGSLAVGTTDSGEYLLKVQHSDTDYASIKVAADNAGHLDMAGWSNGWNINNKTDGRHLYLNRDAGANSDLYLGTQGNEVLVRGSDGYVGVGLTDPDERLDVAGNIRASGVLKTDGSGDNYITGNLGIGVDTPEAALDVDGDMRARAEVYQDKKTTESLTDAGWYRMAKIGQGNAEGIFEIRWARSNRHGHVRFSVAANYGTEENARINVISHACFPATAGQSSVLGIRLLIGDTLETMYIDFEFEGYTDGVAFDIYHCSGHGWSLTEPENAISEIPEDYADYELPVEVTMAVRSGRSNSEFVIDKYGKVGIGTSSPDDILKIESAGNGEGLTIANTRPVITLNDTDANTWTMEMKNKHLRFTEENLDEVMRIEYDTGNVGIGTSEPGELLEVSGNIKASGVLKMDGTGDSYFTGNVGIGITGPETTLHVKGSGATDTVLRLEPGEWNSSGDYATIKFGDDNHYIRGEHSNGMTFHDVNQFYFGGGNVGIQVSDPGEALEVGGNIKASGVLKINGTGESHFKGNVSLEDKELRNVRTLQMKDWDDDTGGEDYKYWLLARDGAFQFYAGGVVVGSYDDGTWSDLSNGNLIVESKVGIGETAPSEPLEVFPDTNVTAIIGRAAVGYTGHGDWAGFSHLDSHSTGGYALLQNSSGRTLLNCASGQKIEFRENNSTHMFLEDGDLTIYGDITADGTISASKVEGAVTWASADYDSGWFTMISQVGAASYKSVTHNLGDYPGRVKVLVQATSGNNSGYIFEGMGSAQSDDDGGAYGGLIFAYNEYFVRLWAPDKNNNESSGRIIFVADGWGGETNTQEDNVAYVRVLCWK